MNKFVTYIDTLAFSETSKENIEKASIALTQMKIILDQKCQDMKCDISELPQCLKEITRIKMVDTFDYFLPFSDSIFIMCEKHENIDLYVLQVADYMLQTYKLSQNIYNSTGNKYDSMPILFRGGIAEGNAYAGNTTAIEAGKIKQNCVLFGEAVVKAVHLENSSSNTDAQIKGGRLLLEESIYNQLKTSKKYCRQLPECKDLYEVLWPMLLYVPQNHVYLLKQEIPKFKEMADELFFYEKKYQDVEKIRIQYTKTYEVLKAATIRFFDINNLKYFAEECIVKWERSKQSSKSSCE